MGLMERWFPTIEQEQEAERRVKEADDAERERIKEFMDVGYQRDFREWLTNQHQTNRPSVADHGEMIHKTGVCDGIQLVLDRLSQLQELSRRPNA